MSCIFCRIVAGEVPADVVYRDTEVMAFRDLHPLAPTHVLVIPQVHIVSLIEATEADTVVLGKVLRGVAETARRLGLAANGYRTVLNSGAGAGQSVFHLHAHLMSGRPFAWPPG